MQCPKCSYVRQRREQAPEWQCPQCGIAYAKHRKEATQARRSARSKQAVAGKRGITFKGVRVFLLMLVLAFVAADSWLTKLRTTDWNSTVRVVIYPINGDGSAVADRYINSLESETFASIERFIHREAERYGITLAAPIEMNLASRLSESPPLPPEDRAIWKVMLWSLKFRWWAFNVESYDGVRPHIRLFTLYYAPQRWKRLQHSTGLEKGMIGIVHAFASRQMTQRNSVVIAHEMLHTLGATDKYDLATGVPIFPVGYAEPNRQPVLPQRLAEIMGGKIPLSPTEVAMPKGLRYSVVGEQTALEIGWIELAD